MLQEDSVIIPLGGVAPEIVHYGRAQAHALGITLRDFMIELLKREYERRPDAPFDPSKVEMLRDWRPGVQMLKREDSPAIFEGEFGSLPATSQQPSEQLVSGDA